MQNFFNFSRRELYEILEEENKILEIIQELPQIKTIAEEREKISCKCTDLASKKCVRDLLHLSHDPRQLVFGVSNLV